MSRIILLEGKAVGEGKVEGEALVSRTPFSFFTGVNTNTGVIIEEGHEHLGRGIGGKILVYPYGKGSSGDCLRLWRCSNNGVAPLAILNNSAESVHVQGAIIAGIPMVYGFEVDILEQIQTGDWLKIDGGMVEIITQG